MVTNSISVAERLYWMDRLLSDPKYNQQELLRKKVSFQWYLASFAGTIVLTAFAFVIGAGIIGNYGLWLSGTYLIGFSAYLAFHYNRYNLFFLFVIILITTVFIARCGGIAHSGGLIFAGLSCAFSTILMNNIYRSMMVFGGYILSILVLGICGPYFPVHPDMTPGINNLFFTINTIWLSASQLLFIIGYLREKDEIEEREAQHLQDLNEAKNRIYTNITHEFRTPLTIILGMAEQLRQGKTAVLDAARLICNNGRHLLKLLNQLLSLARLDTGQESLHWTCTNAVGFLRYLVSSFQSTADQRQLRLVMQTSIDELCMDLDLEKWESIFGNLLTNALKFTPAGGSVTVRVSFASEEVLQVEVADTGTGIPADLLPHIFERFYQVEEQREHHQEGSGIGLALVREYTELLGGTVHVASTLHEGTVFRLRFPIHREALQGPIPYLYQLTDTMEADQGRTELIGGGPSAEELPLLLIVEDNADLVYFLHEILHHHYRVITATNGHEGLTLARRYIPDIIISDIMMPVMDGMRMLEQLKSDQRTSHIPVIMLTAKADQPSRLAGLEKGAEAYLSKPFQREELLIRLRKLLELRKILQKRFAAVENIPEQAPADMSLEDQFMARVRKILALHLDDETFSIAELCRELAMSRTQLYRKFAALTNMTVNQYLRRYRLYEARRLLLETDLSVSQVALEVGLPNPSYFSRVFTETFGINPSQVRKIPPA